MLEETEELKQEVYPLAFLFLAATPPADERWKSYPSVPSSGDALSPQHSTPSTAHLIMGVSSRKGGVGERSNGLWHKAEKQKVEKVQQWEEEREEMGGGEIGSRTADGIWFPICHP